MLGQHAVHAFVARGMRALDRTGHFQPIVAAQRAATHQFAAHFDPTHIAGLRCAQRGVITDVGQVDAVPTQKLDQRNIRLAVQRLAVVDHGAVTAVLHQVPLSAADSAVLARHTLPGGGRSRNTARLCDSNAARLTLSTRLQNTCECIAHAALIFGVAAGGICAHRNA
ncbi:hypothetical protein Xcc3_14880 [Xanthomonas campestris pv. campestris]|nr:hypothetical protein Xcc3_14880 [Xanthomonas campestris pv. campestris]